jgi:CRP/FNR family transcriptional regulator, cyclic AMP receptor protein
MSKCLNCPNAGKYAFCNLGQDSQSFLDLNSVRMDFPRGSILFREGNCCHAVFVMCSGKAKVSATSREGRTMILKIASTGDVLGMSAALANGDYEVTVEALEPCQVRMLPVRYLTQMLQQFSDVSMGVAKTLAKDYRAAFREARLIALSGSPAGRLARLILDWAAEAKEKSPGSFVTISLTHDELASMTATTRETVTRTLVRFRKEKIIATRGVALKVLQPAILEQISAC